MGKTVKGGRGPGWKKLFALAVLVMLAAAGCSTNQSNFLENPKFEKWDNGPEGWRLEGAAEVAKTGFGAELKSSGTATPFLYQTFGIKRRYRGSTMTLEAWVKTNVADSAVIEFSDRKGHDSRSEAHPGDNAWRLLTLTVKAPDSPGNIEFRFRNYKAGSSFIREASMSAGGTPLIAKRLGGAVSTGGWVKATCYVVLLSLLAAVAVFFKKSSKNARSRAYEAFFLLLTLSALMLVAGRPANAVATANIAWAVIALKLLHGFLRKLDPAAVKDAFLRLFKRPGAVFIVASLALSVATVNALRNGSVREAGMTARWAYVLMLLGGASIVARKAWKAIRPEESESVRIYKRHSKEAESLSGGAETAGAAGETQETLV